MTVFFSCSDDDFATPGTGQSGLLTLSESEVTLPAKGRYYTISVGTSESSIRNMTIMADADWIELESDTVYKDGSIEFYVDDNDSIMGRTATITVTALSGATTECTVTQKGLGDDESNSTGDAYFYVGYGYNIFNDYMNTKSLCTPIIDNDKVASLNGGNPLVQKNLRSKEKVDYTTANSLYEMSELLTKQQDKSTSNLLGATKTISRFESNGSTTQNGERYCYMSLKRTVGSASMDYSVLQQMIENGKDVFTPEFREAYDKVIANPTTHNVDNLLSRFGTHLVTYTEIGGAMDLTVNFSYEAKGEINMRAEDFANFFFKHEPSDFTNPGTNSIDGITSDISVGGTFNIIGGSNNVQQQIINSLTANSSNGIDQVALQDWLESLECSSLDDLQTIRDSNIAPVNFQLVPIWSLFPNNLRSIFLERATAMSKQSEDKNFSDWTAGTDVYAFKISGAQFMNFGNGSNQSLVRVVYASNSNSSNMQPVLEICNEYVPTIRGDKRINVVYAIKNGRTFQGAGLFPGDGEGNPPAWLTFSDGQVYVKPIVGKSGTDVLDSVFFIHGNIYDNNLGISMHDPYFMKSVDQSLTLRGFETQEEETYPIVKIGSGYWTRRNINVPMGFGEPMDPTDSESSYYIYESKDETTENRLYACVFKGNDPEFMWYNNNVYDVYNTNDVPTKWHIPQTQDAYNMRDYLGNNLKALFNGQATGFDAQFWGNYSRYDDLNNGRDFGYYDLHYVNEYCFISFKNNSSSATALAISKDYTLRTLPSITNIRNLYPIRLFRNSDYKYK